MTSTRVQKAAKHRAAIMEAARASFEALGYEGTTLRGISRRAGLSTGAFFAQFKNKDELYAEIYGHPPITPEQGRALAAIARSHGVNFFASPITQFLDLRTIPASKSSIEEEDARSRAETAYRNDPSRLDESEDDQVQA